MGYDIYGNIEIREYALKKIQSFRTNMYEFYSGIKAENIFSMWNCFQEFHAVISGSKFTIYRQEKVNVFIKKSIRRELLSLSEMQIYKPA